MVIPINLIVFILIFSLVTILAYFLLNKLSKPDYQIYNNNTTTDNTTNNNINQDNNLNNNNHNQNMGNEHTINTNIDPNKKLTKREQAKMIKKQEKAEKREQIKQMMEAKKLKEQEKEREMLIKEKLKEEEKKKLEETLQKLFMIIEKKNEIIKDLNKQIDMLKDKIYENEKDQEIHKLVEYNLAYKLILKNQDSKNKKPKKRNLIY